MLPVSPWPANSNSIPMVVSSTSPSAPASSSRRERQVSTYAAEKE